MPNETQQAVDWAMQQMVETDIGEVQVSDYPQILLVDKVREYFNDNNINYEMFSYPDLQPYIN